MMKTKPEQSRWTDAQWEAIASNNRPLLTAAAAGSGKTAVLVERIIQKVIDEEEGVDLDELLVVTFTNAAAAEMKQRIGRALQEKLEQDPSSSHLRRQLTLLTKANISTLHSFCLSIIRSYYYTVDIDPAFRLLDQTEASLIAEETCEELLESRYESREESFRELASYFTGDKTDEALRQLILEVYQFSRAHPDPDAWLDQILDTYDGNGALSHKSWFQEADALIRQKYEAVLQHLEQALDTAQSTGGPSAYAPVLEEERSLVLSVLEAGDRKRRMEAVRTLSFGRLPAVKKEEDVEEELKTRTKKFREEAKKKAAEIRPLALQPEEEAKADLSYIAPVIKTLVSCVREFSRMFYDAKQKRQSLDFNDLEHTALHILYQHGEPSDVAVEYRKKLKEVLVDEYQDTNFVQEAVLTAAAGEDRLFMVGDVKQSIYRFRLAEPGLFQEKYDTLPTTKGSVIDLSENFRSRREVLEAVNFLFRQIMSREFGELDYNEEASLKPGNEDYPQIPEIPAEVVLIEKDNGEEETAEAEARACAQEIRKMIDGRTMVYDRALGTERPLKYRDIVLLSRSMTWADAFDEAFADAGIPLHADRSSGYFDAVEIRIMLSLLQVMDNPRQDIPLAAVLRSPIFQLTEPELAEIRTAAPEGSYFDAFSRAAEDNPRFQESYDLLKKWRLEGRYMSVSSFIWYLYRETGYLDFAGGLPGGRQRQANLTALYDRARGYEKTTFRGLFRFLRFIERMKERGDDLGTADAVGEQEDVVRYMTIHKSKGLEFPVVFCTGMARPFNLMDLHKPYLLHRRLGFASRKIDSAGRTSYPTLYYHLVREQIHRETLAEEMRVLYVAMTRAEQRLILTGTVDSVEKRVEKWADHLPEKAVPLSKREGAKSYFDWLMPSLMQHAAAGHLLEQSGFPEGSMQSQRNWQIRVWEEEEVTRAAGEPVEHTSGVDSSTMKEAVYNRLDWQYPYTDSVSAGMKQSVSEIKRRDEDPYAVSYFQPVEELHRPSFMQKKRLSAAEYGTAMHLLLQHLPLSFDREEQVERKADELVEKKLMTPEERESVDESSAALFLQSSLAETMRNAHRLYRELPFSLPMPAQEVYTSWSDPEETVFVQGIIDVCVVTEEGTRMIVDYKTNRRRKEETVHAFYERLKEQYALQLNMYARALKEAWGGEAPEALLYVLETGETVRIPAKNA
ncbi:helicase-exonuclease AddAB subunit AddA [Alkalicoccus urumqiensis]|uniref:ATP-dependent helicase/nuclease subunit A n=1 Tax=Alkalicoccus urumqiensis TaxID=1548213 RepID=A0A2P6MKU7_ALKUR|nr:helicase-exonuclease AddAB subunit AddA [Alkalicoccus urumqiensis]PRO66908.1 helicase-exonuclease AddAB subunit AddA [Alkalicoccus urumqiensis]